MSEHRCRRFTWGDIVDMFFLLSIAVLIVTAMAYRWVHAGEPAASSYLRIASETMIWTGQAETIKSVAAVPGQTKCLNGQDGYGFEVRIDPQFYVFCWGDQGKRDEALRSVESRLGVGR